jgi:hypothetical protein
MSSNIPHRPNEHHAVASLFHARPQPFITMSTYVTRQERHNLVVNPPFNYQGGDGQNTLAGYQGQGAMGIGMPGQGYTSQDTPFDWPQREEHYPSLDRRASFLRLYHRAPPIISLQCRAYLMTAPTTSLGRLSKKAAQRTPGEAWVLQCPADVWPRPQPLGLQPPRRDNRSWLRTGHNAQL